MVKFVAVGMKVKCIAGNRKQYGWVGTIVQYKHNNCVVWFDNGQTGDFGREELRDVTPRRLGRGA